MSKKNRKRKFEGDDQLVLDWEQENLMSVEMKSEIESMWEVSCCSVVVGCRSLIDISYRFHKFFISSVWLRRC